MILLGLVEVADRQDGVASRAPKARPMIKALIDDEPLGEEHGVVAFTTGLALWNNMSHLKSEKQEA
jgi:hypothetical protein